jgi:signal peptidase I
MLILRWFLSRTVRQALDLGRQVRKLAAAQRDLLPAPALADLERAVGKLRALCAGGEGRKAIESGMAELEKTANRLLLPYPAARWRENVEVLLVTGAVVLAIRTFFFQPMAIPSGSAQPTLWGITHENLIRKPGAQIPSGLDRIVQSCWSGIHYYHVVARRAGEVTRVDPPRLVLPFVKRQTLWVGDDSYTLWFPPDDLAGRAELRRGRPFQAGEDIIKLRVVSGDHLFVNRVVYNFRKPHRGDIIVFQSHGIPGLIADTHYIKRLVALGGERVRIGNDRHLIIDGQRLDASTPGFENVYGFNPKQPPRADHFSGHVNDRVSLEVLGRGIAPLFPDERSEFRVPPRHLLAFGDNTMNSHDGRAWGDFPEEKVVGKSSFVFWPITDRFGWGYR